MQSWYLKFKRMYWPKLHTALFFVGVGVIGIVSWRIIVWGQAFKKETGLTATMMVKLLINGGATLSSSQNRTNILILGVSGGTHPGADLTDTMLVLSLDQTNHTASLVSIPRDLWSETLQDKINSAYHYGEEKAKGLILAKTITEEVIGLPIQYGFVIDFSGFTRIIDLVGGVNVVVPNAFTDPEFPIAGKENDLCSGDPLFGCRYEALHFDSGLQHMDGTLALKYVRSRHAEGEEGSDFARSRRQQDVLVALEAKLLNPKFITRPSLVLKLFHAFDDATDTDMTVGELLTIGKFLAKANGNAMERISFEDQLISPPLWQYKGRYVLVPKESFEALHEFINKAIRDKR